MICLRILVALLLALAAPRGLAQSADVATARFDEGVRAYTQGDFDAAERAWRECLTIDAPGGPARAAVLYDLGNAAYRQKRPLEAVALYTASLRLAPRDSDAWHNLELARREAGLDPADRGDLAATARRVASSLTAAESSWLVLALGALLALALAFEALRGGSAARTLALVTACAAVAASGQWAWLRQREGRELVLVTAREGASVRSEPRGEAPVVGRLAPAREVECIDGLPGWVRVRDGGLGAGWIEADDAVAISPSSSR